MKKFIFFIWFASVSITNIAQEKETILNTPSDWQVEIIPFPIDFAPEIPFTGIEDLRFAPNWYDSTQADYWTYTFAWYIDIYKAMNTEILEEAFNQYYDGLMGVTAPNSKLEKTETHFKKTKEGFEGQMRTYDRLFSKSYIHLNIKVYESFCTQINKQIVWCNVSIKPYDHSTWKIFDQISLKNCK